MAGDQWTTPAEEGERSEPVAAVKPDVECAFPLERKRFGGELCVLSFRVQLRSRPGQQSCHLSVYQRISVNFKYVIGWVFVLRSRQSKSSRYVGRSWGVPEGYMISGLGRIVRSPRFLRKFLLHSLPLLWFLSCELIYTVKQALSVRTAHTRARAHEQSLPGGKLHVVWYADFFAFWHP